MRGTAQYQGMNFVRQSTRLAIYLRDGLACVWCGRGVEELGVGLSLDHLKPYSKGGSHEAENLVTACKTCNSSRGDRPVAVFARVVAAYMNTQTPDEILRRVRACSRRALRKHRQEARELIARRGSVARVLATREEA